MRVKGKERKRVSGQPVSRGLVKTCIISSFMENSLFPNLEAISTLRYYPPVLYKQHSPHLLLRVFNNAILLSFAKFALNSTRYK